jgi:hypothetical protein
VSKSPISPSSSATEPADDPRPEAPVPPELEDCCQSGCSPCVFDLYDTALEEYKAALAAWRERHPQAQP